MKALALDDPGATFIDIGSSIGNHSLYFATFLKAKKVIPIEPNPVAYNLLLANVVLNGLSDVIDLTRVGVGMSDEDKGGFGVEDRERNIGATRMIAGEGEIQVFRGDTLLADEAPTFITIDVEGMEMDVLAGLEATISTHRPNLLVEVDEVNYETFESWFSKRNYEAVKVFQRYRTKRNYLLSPKD